jgi:hypothetical protein
MSDIENKDKNENKIDNKDKDKIKPDNISENINNDNIPNTNSPNADNYLNYMDKNNQRANILSNNVKAKFNETFQIQ